MKPDFHRKHSFSNSDHHVVIGNFPWYEIKDPFDQPPRDLIAALSRAQLSHDRVWLMKQGETRAIPL